MIDEEDIYIGQGVTVRSNFRDPETKELVAANDVVITFKKPSNEIVEVDVNNPELGKYYGRIVVDEPGLWKCRIVSVEPGAAADQFDFKVKHSNI